jgi:hypothetical protein
MDINATKIPQNPESAWKTGKFCRSLGRGLEDKLKDLQISQR